MSETSYQHGDFCWHEIGTRDVEGSKAFYTRLLGWEVESTPMPGEASGTYHMFKAGEDGVGGLFEMQGEGFEGVPPHWLTYIYAPDVDATASRAAELGGTVVNGPFDIPGIGRMAVLQDPAGAVFCIYRAAGDEGGPLDEPRPGTVGWNELMSRDVEASKAFFTELFGWGVQEMPMGESGTYYVMTRGEQGLGGMMGMEGDQWGEVPSHFMSYLTVEDCEACSAQAAELGGTVHVPPSDIEGIGRFSIIQDPQGATFAIMQWVMGSEA